MADLNGGSEWRGRPALLLWQVQLLLVESEADLKLVSTDVVGFVGILRVAVRLCCALLGIWLQQIPRKLLILFS